MIRSLSSCLARVRSRARPSRTASTSGTSLDANGMLGAPNYSIQGSSYFNVGDASGAPDSHVSNELRGPP